MSNTKETKKPLGILKNCFMKEGQSIRDFAPEVKELKTLPDYKEFVQECADFLGVNVDWS